MNDALASPGAATATQPASLTASASRSSMAAAQACDSLAPLVLLAQRCIPRAYDGEPADVEALSLLPSAMAATRTLPALLTGPFGKVSCSVRRGCGSLRGSIPACSEGPQPLLSPQEVASRALQLAETGIQHASGAEGCSQAAWLSTARARSSLHALQWLLEACLLAGWLTVEHVCSAATAAAAAGVTAAQSSLGALPSAAHLGSRVSASAAGAGISAWVHAMSSLAAPCPTAPPTSAPALCTPSLEASTMPLSQRAPVLAAAFASVAAALCSALLDDSECPGAEMSARWPPGTAEPLASAWAPEVVCHFRSARR
jgi:hypothetical protein